MIEEDTTPSSPQKPRMIGLRWIPEESNLGELVVLNATSAWVRRRNRSSFLCMCNRNCIFDITILIIIISIVFVVMVVMLQNLQVMLPSFVCCWYSGGIPSRSGIKPEQSTWLTMGGSPPASMRAPWSSGSSSSCPHPGPPFHRAIMQRISIQNTILVHDPLSTCLFDQIGEQCLLLYIIPPSLPLFQTIPKPILVSLTS